MGQFTDLPIPRRAAVKQSDMTRYLKATVAAGIVPGKIEVSSDGTVTIYPGDVGPRAGSNPCDRLLK
jgi:hypothetical protein